MADLTAAALIAILRENPGACWMLGIQTHSTDNSVDCWKDEIKLRPRYLTNHVNRFRRWLTGAAVEKCDELGIFIDQEKTMELAWYWVNRRTTLSDPRQYPTRLHAALAALEQHAKEKSNG